MQPEDLELMVRREMPFGKLKGRIIADLPATTSTGLLARDFRRERLAVCWR